MSGQVAGDRGPPGAAEAAPGQLGIPRRGKTHTGQGKGQGMVGWVGEGERA